MKIQACAQAQTSHLRKRPPPPPPTASFLHSILCKTSGMARRHGLWVELMPQAGR